MFLQSVNKLPNGDWHRYKFADAYKEQRLASVLVSQFGVKPGDRVTCLRGTITSILRLYFGIPGAGAVVIRVNLRLPADQVAFIIEHTADRVMFIRCFTGAHV